MITVRASSGSGSNGSLWRGHRKATEVPHLCENLDPYVFTERLQPDGGDDDAAAKADAEFANQQLASPFVFRVSFPLIHPPGVLLTQQKRRLRTWRTGATCGAQALIFCK
jgi:hypothetical protein